jgi:hypothetical protein
MPNSNIFEKQLNEIVVEYESKKEKSKHHDCSDVLDEQQVMALHTRCLASIERVAGKCSTYYELAERILNEKKNAWDHLAGLVGVVQTLLYDLRKGYLKSLEEIIHADLFADFLEMADHLTYNGYKDAAAVIAGSTLEAHLRKLADKNAVPINSGSKPKKADTLNAELIKLNCYSKLDQKNITAWLGMRNDAAHGNYSAYDKNQVQLLISSIRDFITRNPA